MPWSGTRARPPSSRTFRSARRLASSRCEGPTHTHTPCPPAHIPHPTPQVDSVQLKSRLKPSPQQCLDAIQELVPQLMHRECEQQLEDLNSVNPIVESIPSTAEDFVGKMSTIEDVRERLTSLMDTQRRVESMAMLMHDQGWPLPDQASALLTTLQGQMQRLDTGLQSAEARVEEDTAHFAREIDQGIAALKREVLDARSKLDDDRLLDADADMEEVLEFLAARTEVRPISSMPLCP